MTGTSQPQSGTSIALLPLLLAIAIMIGVTVYPALVTDAEGRPSHGLLLLMCWGMSAGFVRGVGFIPRHPVLRWLLSTASACGATAVAAVYIAYSQGML